MRILNGFDVDTRERVWVDDPEANAAFMAEVKTTPAGKTYFEDFASTENNEVVIAAVWKLYPDIEHVTISAFIDALATCIAAGALTRVSEPEVPVVQPEPVPTDKNGRPLTSAQIRWAEMTRFANEKSMREINERKRVDPIFANFVRTNLRREFESVGDSLVEANPHLIRETVPSTSGMSDQRLVDFATRFRSMSSEDVRKSRRLDINPLTARQFVADENECYQKGLL